MFRSVCAAGNLIALVKSYGDTDLKNILLSAFDGNQHLPMDGPQVSHESRIQIPDAELRQMMKIFLNVNSAVSVSRMRSTKMHGVTFAAYKNSKRDSHICFFDQGTRHFGRIIEILECHHEDNIHVAVLIRPFRLLEGDMVVSDPYKKWADIAGQLFHHDPGDVSVISIQSIAYHASFREIERASGEKLVHLVPLDKV